ncbi:MAG: hypothetical protein QXU98_13150 [Candidatus Parvarchaeota archaeon]
MKLKSLILGVVLSLVVVTVSFANSSNTLTDEYLKASEQLKKGNFYNASILYSSICKQGFEAGCNMLPLSMFPINDQESLKLAEERVLYYEPTDLVRSEQLCLTYIIYYYKYNADISWFLKYLSQHIKN